MTDMNEAKAEWVRAALRDYEGPLVRYAAQITGDLDRARDVVQDTFVRLCDEEPARLDSHLAEWCWLTSLREALLPGPGLQCADPEIGAPAKTRRFSQNPTGNFPGLA